MVLFDEVLSAIDLGAHRLATDPDEAAVCNDNYSGRSRDN
jgi:hypothetical protein